MSRVLIDFYLWDLPKRIEGGEAVIEGIAIQPDHHTGHRVSGIM